MERLNHTPSLAPTRLSPLRGRLAASKVAGRFCVDPGQPLHLAGDTDLRVEVVQGRIWLTSAGDTRDHFPAAGTRLDFAVGSDLVIEADGGPAVVALTPALRGAAVGDGLGHGLGFATPGKPLVAVASVLQRTAHDFAPVKGPATTRPPASGGRHPDGQGKGQGQGHRARVADWVRAIAGALRDQFAQARARRLIHSLDSRQLRDMGAAEHVILYRERLEREAKMRARMMSDGI